MLNGNGFAVGGPSDGGFGATDGRLNGTSNGSTMLINSPLGPTLALQGIDGGSRPDGELSFNGSGPVASTSRNGYGPSIFDQRSPAASSSTHFGNINSPPRLHDAASSDLFHQVSAGLKSSANLAATASGYSRAAQAEDPNMPTMESSTEYPGRTAQSVRPLTSEEAYRTVTKPYPYAQGYHYLVRHLKERSVVPPSAVQPLSLSRFEKNDILRIIRALAAFRPSLIALQMPLSEEDEVRRECTGRRLTWHRPLSNGRSSARSSSSTSSSLSRGHQQSCGVARARSASSGPSSVCSPAGVERSCWARSTSSRYVARRSCVAAADTRAAVRHGLCRRVLRILRQACVRVHVVERDDPVRSPGALGPACALCLLLLCPTGSVFGA